jgi:hypothetical protein
MTTYLERYKAGEYEQVWAELRTLGPKVRQEPVLADAKAVARETMGRARANVEKIVERLRAIGFDFRYPDQAFLPPSSETLAQLDEFEQKVGPIPLSLRAWLEIVGEVNLMGTYPGLSYYAHSADFGANPFVAFTKGALETGHVDSNVLNTLLNSMKGSTGFGSADFDPAMLGNFQDRINAMLSQAKPLLDLGKGGFMNERTEPRWSIPSEEQMVSDPLVVGLDEMLVDQYEDYLMQREEGEIDDNMPFVVSIAPDIHHKSNMSGGGGYDIALPDPAVDGVLIDSGYGTFVDHLRISFRWGGFPGLQDYENRDKAMLDHLREGLLPI